LHTSSVVTAATTDVCKVVVLEVAVPNKLRMYEMLKLKLFCGTEGEVIVGARRIHLHLEKRLKT